MIRRRWIVSAAALLLLAAVVLGWFWYRMGEPLYRPGMVRAATNLSAPLPPPPQANEPGVWQVERGVRLHHVSVGSGSDVLIVHGGPGRPTTQPWPALDALTGQHRFIYYDQRGCGRSTRPIERFATGNFVENMRTLERTLGLGAQVADIERIRRILGHDQLTLIGHSFGAFLAALYAAEFPQHVKALVLVTPADVLVFPQEGGLFVEIERRLPPAMKASYADFLKRYLDYGSLFAKDEDALVALNAEFDPFYAEAAKAAGFALPPAGEAKSGGGWMVHAMYLSMGRRHDYRDALRGITAPTLVIHGANDLQPEASSRRYAELISGARFEVIAGAGHFPFLDQREAFATAVGRFLSPAR